MIFKSFADTAPDLVTGLLQVCKRWHDITVNSPRLWTHIHIKVEPRWDLREAARKNAEMVKSRLKHSASLPLHINLDLKDMLDEESQTDEYTAWARCKNELCREATRYFDPTDEYIDHVASISESYGPGQVSWIVDVLVGEDGMHMSRWKTLHILLPSNGRDVKEIWELFSGRAPQLTELHISGKGLSRRELVFSIKDPVKFPNLSSLETLALPWAHLPSVKRLDLEMNISRSSQLSLFTSLDYPDVLFYGVSAAGAVPAIHLPVLRELTIHVYGPTGVEWRVPVLQTLTIFGSFDDESKSLPNVQALKVRWEVAQPANPTGSEPELHCTLQTILSKYGDMEKLSIHISLKPVWEKYVQDLREEKRLVLPMVDFYGS